MNKKIVIPIIVCLVLIIGIVGFIIWNNRIVSTITLDINPSIEINLTKVEKVKSVVALNEDAKDIIDNDLNGKTLKDAIDDISKLVIEKGYIDDDQVVIILYSTGNIKNEEIESEIRDTFAEQNINAEIVVIENITKEDEELAKRYNVSPAKISYIKSVVMDNENIGLESLINKSATELNEMKNTGNYCDDGYILDGSRCLKEIERLSASNGEVCPRGYLEYEGKCYDETPSMENDNLYCNEEFTLENDKCKRTLTIDAETNYTCNEGELMRASDAKLPVQGNDDKMYCVDKSTGQAPILRCLYNPGHIMIGGKCYNGPAPTINGGCPNGDTLVNGSCYSLDDEDQWQCPNGGIYHKSQNSVPELCPDTLKYTEAIVTGYSCPDNYALSGTKCVQDEIEDAQRERVCPNGYTLVNNDRCINYNKTTQKENGFVCEGENAKLKGNMCIIYEAVEAKHN